MSDDFDVEVPGGGTIQVKDEAEVDFWNKTVNGYIRDYDIENQNDLAAIGSIATQSLFKYRAQREAAAGEGNARDVQIRVEKSEEAIEKIEKRLGIDKRSRDKDAQNDTATHMSIVKQACLAKGIRISERTLEFERIMKEASWKLRILLHGDAEDRREMGLTERSFLEWLERELAEVDARDDEWDKEQGALVVGTL